MVVHGLAIVSGEEMHIVVGAIVIMGTKENFFRFPCVWQVEIAIIVT